MVKFLVEPGYDVKSPEREYGNAGIDFFIPKYSETFEQAFNEKNNARNAYLCKYDDGDRFIRIRPHCRANIPSGIRSRFDANIALEAQNKSGIATRTGLVIGAAVVDSSYKGIIHLSLINTTDECVDLPVGMKIMQFVPRFIDTSEIEVCRDMSLDEFYKGFEFSHRGEGAFGSTGV